LEISPCAVNGYRSLRKRLAVKRRDVLGSFVERKTAGLARLAAPGVGLEPTTYGLTV